MAFFKRELGPVESFESALKRKRAARQKMAERLNLTEKLLEEQRAAARRLAVAGATHGQLDRAEAKMRSVEDRARGQRAELDELDEQIASTERALAEAVLQRDRNRLADDILALAAAIEQAVPQFNSSAVALVQASQKGVVLPPEATRFSTSVDEMRREVLSSADLICWELRSIAVRTRAGNANVALGASAEPHQRPSPETERQLIYTLSPLLWREGDEVRRVPAFTLVGLPRDLLPVALRHQHADYLSARRVQTLIQVHGSGSVQEGQGQDDPETIDLDALAAEETGGAPANVA
ncbi:hypothetical protein [Bradyrhizobium iriomotense]|uniref:Uncharacterized protein n=1 Tax=Bradyrhizobium iriomotense TaxID=441950 RepID=A0ABQ6B7K9_9BRAD|nr:hypothetical protein [Bradyrhizobium iriomotense]GLR88178.1 hypothetical protein GCM10007857_48900 [Bradyrhizobium iriomotense]